VLTPIKEYISEFFDYGKIILDTIKSRRNIGRYSGIVSPLSPCSNNPEVLLSHQHEVANLKSALDNKEGNVRNIAVAGPYGAGKSTFILSFERYYSKYKYLNISLATFLESAVSSLNKPESIAKSVLSDKEIEESIVQHILYKEHPSKTPASSYKRIPHAYISKRIWFSIIAFFTLLSSIFLFFQNHKNPPEIIKNTVEFLTDTIPFIEFIAFSIISYFIFRLLFWFSHIALTFDFRRIFSKDGAIAISDDASPLNQHLDEIIYFFFKTDYNVVVFEDLDRFNNVSIFTKLREINHLVNQSKFITQDVKFVYAIKDELLNAKERTKFFDLIIPILPIVHPNNALSVFQRELSEVKFTDKKLLDLIEPELLKNISRYIDDMRILKNICNEYLSYINKLNNEVDCDLNKVFAMVTFKNLCPSQHSELLVGKGVIAQVFKSLVKAKSNKLLDSRESILLLKKTVLAKEQLVTETKEEIFHLYWSLFAKKNNLLNQQIVRFQLGRNKAISIEEIFSQNGFEQILNSPKNFQVVNAHNQVILHHGNNQTTYKDIDDSRTSNYLSSIKLLEADKLTTKGKITAFEKVINRINQQNLKEFLAEHPMADLVSTCQCENECKCHLDWLSQEELPSLATSYLLIEGYIAEDYPEYLSVFVAGALTSSDKNKLNSIRAGHELEPDYKFTKLESVVDDLTSRDFRFNTNLNHQLVGFISTKIISNIATENEVDIWSQLFNNGNNDSQYLANFIFEHFAIHPESKLINALYKHCFDAFVKMLDDIIFEPRLTKLLIEQLEVSELKELFEKQEEDHIVHIAEVTELKSVCDGEDSYEKLTELELKFTRLKEENNSKEEFRFVLDFGLFDFNLKMVRAIRNSISDKFNLGDEEQLTFAQAEELITEKSIYPERLLTSIEDNISAFITEVLCKQKFYSEPLVNLIERLNQIDVSLGAELIKASETQIIDLSEIKAIENWCILLESGKLEPNWHNIELCFNALSDHPKNDENTSFSLIDSIQSYIQLDFTTSGLSETCNDLENIDSDLILDNLLNFDEISDDTYEKLLPLFPSTNLYSDTLLLTTTEKARKLISNRLLDYSPDIVKWLITEELQILLIDYIIYYATEYLEDSNSELLPTAVFEKVLSSNSVSNELKQLYVRDVLLIRYSEIEEFDSLLSSIMTIFGEMDFEAVCNLKIPNQLLDNMLNINDIRFSDLRTKLVASQVANMDWQELSSALLALNSVDFRAFTSGTGNISIAKDKAFNAELLNALQKKGLIGKINEHYFTLMGYTRKSKIPS
jgi:hypothetical protein